MLPLPWYSYLNQCYLASTVSYSQCLIKLSDLWVKNRSTMCGLLITFIHLSSLLVLWVVIWNKSCNSGQCISADEKVKNNAGAPTWFIIALRSSLTFYQYASVPAILPTYRDIFDMKTVVSLFSAISRNSSTVRCASPGFGFKNIPVCWSVLFLKSMLKAQYENLGRYTHLPSIFSANFKFPKI